MIKIWLDDIRTPPSDDWVWIKSVNDAKKYISMVSSYENTEIILSLDHDSGEFYEYGGDYIRILDWLDGTGWSFKGKFHFHSMNVVGVQNMRAIIQRNGWEEI